MLKESVVIEEACYIRNDIIDSVKTMMQPNPG